MSEMPHDASDTKYKSWNRFLGCAPIPLPSLHMHHLLLLGDLLCGCQTTCMQSSRLAEKPPVAQPWPLLVELRPARRRELVKRSQRLTKPSVTSVNCSSRDIFWMGTLTLSTPMREEVFSRSMSI